MSHGDVYEALAELRYPMPDPNAVTTVGADGHEIVMADAVDAVLRDRRAFIDNLHAAVDAAEHDDEFADPVLLELAGYRAQIVQAQQQLRVVLAYAREFVRPHGYQLDPLARAAGLSKSGVRIAYDDHDISTVTRRTGQRPRPRRTSRDT